MRWFPADLQECVWRAYFSRHVLTQLRSRTARKHYTNRVLPEIKDLGAGRMWRAFVSSNNVFIGVSRATDDGMDEAGVRGHVAALARQHVPKPESLAAPVEIREIGSREVHVFDKRGRYERMYVS